jgi:hypothetical protein
MKPKLTQRVLLLVVLLMTFVMSWSQENDGFVSASIAKNTSFTQVIQSNAPGASFEVLPANAPGNLAATEVTQNSGDWEIRLDATNDFTGITSFVVKYYSGVPGQSAPKYITYQIEVLESVVSAVDDYIVYPSGNADIEIDVRSNDTTTAGALDNVNIVQLTGGTAVVNASNNIIFTPTVTSDFSARIEYVVYDDLGGSALGTVIIQSDDVPVVDTLSFTLTNNESFDVLLTDDNCVIYEETAFGQMSLDGFKLSYEPDADSEGIDSGILVDSNLDTTVVVFNVLLVANPTDFVKDDYINTPTNVSINFDVCANDLDTFCTIVDYSSELTHIDEGNFSYTPPAWYEGNQTFYYTVYNGLEHQTAEIFMSVSNLTPLSMTDYVLNGLENEAIVLNYEIPLTDYNFEILSPPSSGSLSILNGQDTIGIDCNEIIGAGTILYTPDTDFTGTDDFDLRYFVNGNPASIVKITAEIHEDDQAHECHCVGLECVWPGDTNNNGIVDITDLLPVGLHMGAAGESRNDLTYSFWNGQASEDWDSNQSSEGANMKYVDADGDGLVTSDDVDYIIDNYDSAHNLRSALGASDKDYGLTLEWLNEADTVYTGEQLCLGLNLGNEDFPVIELHGVALDLNVNPLVIDSSTTEVNFPGDSWLSYNSSQLDLMVQPYDGRVDMAFTRSDGSSASGYGSIGSACFIVEDDVLGIRSGLEEPISSVEVNTSNISVMDVDGRYFSLKDASIEIPLAKRKKGSKANQELLLYPNPVSRSLNIHLNSASDIKDLYVIDMTGRTLSVNKNINSDHTVLDVSNLDTGIYVAKVFTNDGYINKKFKVISK